MRSSIFRVLEERRVSFPESRGWELPQHCLSGSRLPSRGQTGIGTFARIRFRMLVTNWRSSRGSDVGRIGAIR